MVVVSRNHVPAPFLRLRRLRVTVLYIRRSSGVMYRCVSSRTMNVSLPPSFEAEEAVDGVISPPPGRMIRVSPASTPVTWLSRDDSSTRLKCTVS